MISLSTRGGPPAFQFKAPREPMLWTAAAYAAGIIVGVYFWRPAAWWILASVTFAAAAAYFAVRRAGLGWIVALGAFVLTGALQVQLQSASPKLDTSIQPFADRRGVAIIGHIIREGRLQQGGFGEMQQTLDLEAKEIQPEMGVRVSSHS